MTDKSIQRMRLALYVALIMLCMVKPISAQTQRPDQPDPGARAGDGDGSTAVEINRGSETDNRLPGPVPVIPPDKTAVTAIRFLSWQSYTRVMLDLSQEAKYEVRRLKEDPSKGLPARLYVDIQGARVALTSKERDSRRRRLVAPGAHWSVQRRHRACRARHDQPRRAQCFCIARSLPFGHRYLRSKGIGTDGADGATRKSRYQRNLNPRLDRRKPVAPSSACSRSAKNRPRSRPRRQRSWRHRQRRHRGKRLWSSVLPRNLPPSLKKK